MTRQWVRSAVMAGGAAVFVASTALSVAVIKGREVGTVVVSNVYELMNAIRISSDYDTIVLSKLGSPYELSEQPCMNGDGHLYVDKRVTIKGQTDNPEDVVLKGTTNRILYVKAIGVKIQGMSFVGGNCSTNEKGEVDTSSARVSGGGIYLGMASNECRISNCIFTNNSAFRGGAIASAKPNDITSSIVGCKFLGNTAESYGGAVYNGGRIIGGVFSDNISYVNGGAVAYGYVEDSISRGNNAKKGSDLYECAAYEYTLTDIGETNVSRFYNCELDRCRISVTNGVLFSGFFDVRNSLISDGANFELVKKAEFKYLPQPEGEGLLYPIAPQIVSSTIVSNLSYRVFVPPQILFPDMDAHMNVSNCLFYGNSMEGYKINKDVATNGTFKTIALTKGQRLVAFGWDGYFPERGTTNYYESYNQEEFPEGFWCSIDYSQLDEIYTNVTTQVPDGYQSETYSLTWREYYYAMGWDGVYDITFAVKYRGVPLSPLSAGVLTSLKDYVSTDLTWYQYYIDNGWDGTGDYAGPLEYDIRKRDLQFIKIANCIACIEEVGTNIINTYIYNRQTFNPRFLLSTDAINPYSIDMSSLACHLNFGTQIEQIPIDTWMINSKDLRGIPRTSGGGLDIGAYQAFEESQ